MPDLQNIIGDEGDILRRGAGGALDAVTPTDLAADPAFSDAFGAQVQHPVYATDGDLPAPSAGNAGYLATVLAYEDKGSVLVRSNGSAWVQVGAGSAEFAALTVVKSANESINNSSSMQNDDHLVLAVAANTTYLLDAYLRYEATTTGDIKAGFSVPTGAAVDWNALCLPGTHSSGTSGSLSVLARTDAQTATLGGAGAGTLLVARITGTVTVGGTAGSLQFRWAQQTADVSDSIVYAGSWLRLTPVA